jgi:hypothetical protein
MTTPNDTPETLHDVALKMVDTLDSLGILPEITDTLRRAIRAPMVSPAPVMGNTLLNRCLAAYDTALWHQAQTFPRHREAIRQVVLQAAAELLVMHQRNDGRLSAHDAAQMLREEVG